MLRIAIALLLLTSVAHAGDDDLDYSNPATGDGSWPGPSENERFCAETYPLQKKPKQADTERCATFFATEAQPGGVWNWKLTREQMTALAKRLGACKPCDEDAKGAVATLDNGKQLHAGLTDAGTGESIEPLLAKIFAGEQLAKKDLRILTPLTLWRLRNAPYARHGRVFKSPELQAFFYKSRGVGSVTGGTAASKVLPLKFNLKYSDSMLDKADNANVALVMGEIKRRKAE